MRIHKPNLRFSGNLSRLVRVEKLIQHHMAHPSWGVEQVHEFHRDTRGWHGIGYNYWIGFDGEIYEGRGGNQGAHAGAGWNGRSLGIGYQGDLSSQQMTDAQVRAGAWLNAKLIEQHGLSVEDIVGHGDVANTACPGANFRIAELREKTKQILEGEDMLEVAIVINSFADFPAVEPLAHSLDAPIFLRSGLGQLRAEKVIVCGGGTDGLPDTGGEVVDLSGSNRFETYRNIENYL